MKEVIQLPSVVEEKGGQVKAISNINLIQNRTPDYKVDCGAYPTSMQDLFSDKISLETMIATRMGTSARTKAPLEYMSGLCDSSPSTCIILCGPADFQGKVLVGRIDGTAKFIPEADFLREARTHGISFPTWSP